jgi:hypothetical protein
MSLKKYHIGIIMLLVVALAPAVFAEKGRIYGKIYTDRGDILEGPIRWDKNEASWDDMIDGYKELSKKAKKETLHRYGDKNTKVKFFGLTIYSDGSSWGGTRECAISFGHIKRLTPESDDGALLLLKSGEEALIQGSSTDLGSGIREIIVEDAKEGELELDWSDIDYIEFMDGGDVTSMFGDRIYGTVITSRAGEYTGWISWDVDEMFVTDIIDGSERGRKRKIKFSQIARIEKISSQASLVVLKNGEELRLDDSNDIDSGNRGIVISDLKLGRITVQWDEFESLDIKQPSATDYVSYADFDGGRPLTGTVYDENGDKYTGTIRWDDDEEYTWEVLDGNYRDVEFDIPFEHIKSIEKLSDRTGRVVLWDGRELKLRDSNDVNDENNGVFVATGAGGKDEVEIDWTDFDRVEFQKK